MSNAWYAQDLIAQVYAAIVDEKVRVIASRTPLGRIGAPAEIAEVILFLADAERSSFVTGTSVVADGGALARLATE